MRNNGWRLLLVLILAAGMLVLAAGSALAGWNEVTICTDGNGYEVYAASTGSKKAGLLYNGYSTGLPLDDENGRYRHELTEDYAIYIDIDKAETRLPDYGDFASYEEYQANVPSKIWVAEIAGENTPIYTTPKNKKMVAKHAKGSLVMVCGEFGDDYYVEGSVDGFVEKSALQKVKDMSFREFRRGDYGYEDLPEVTLYASELHPVFITDTATGYYKELEYYISAYTENRKVEVLRDLGDWVQLANNGFVEKRFLDPEGDHSYPTARVKTDGKLDRLIVHYNNVKLVSGTRVHVVAHTEEWAVIFVTGENGGIVECGNVKMEYLSFDENEQIRDGSAQVRLTKELQGDESMKYFAETKRKPGGTLPADTLLKVIGVYSSGSGESNQSDDFLCETEDGKYIEVSGGEYLEPLESTGLMATARQAVRMREEPSPEAKVMHQVKAKTKVEVLLRGEIWTLVKYKDETGYMMSRYLSFP